MALGVINYCYDHGLSVPGDYDVAGFGGSHIGSLYRPRLTTVVEPYYEFGAIAMRFMTKILQKEQTFDSSVYLPAHIDERESTRRK